MNDSPKVIGGFWHRLMELNRRATIPAVYRQLKKTGRIDAMRLDWKPGRPKEPHIFWDSDVAKWIEAAAYTLRDRPDAGLERRIDRIVRLMKRAQLPDGYLNSHFIAVEPDRRWTNLRDNHELYCAGHLIEAAVALNRATGNTEFLDIVRRYADHIGRIFGRGRGQKRGYPGHEEIELALIRLYRATGEKLYLDLARYFVEERGRRPHYFDLEARARGEDPRKFWARTYAYCQAHRPIREQTEVVGHAVRAMYLYSGMTDVAFETGDRTLFAACRRLWRHLVERRMHITGGIGPTHENEGFTSDYDLPNEGAYLETCAAVGLVFWASRMLRVELNGEYGDVMERALCNGALSGLSADGEKFFYGNPLAVQPGFDGNGHYVGSGYHYRRSEWLWCACCPPNISRLIGQIPDLLYTCGPDWIAAHLFADCESCFDVRGTRVVVRQESGYPWDGRVTFRVLPDEEKSWAFFVRMPGWCRKPLLRLNGREQPLENICRSGYARVARRWAAGDTLQVEFPMPVEMVEAHPSARHDCGRVAIQRGPVVYCFEEVDNGRNLNDLVLPRDPDFRVVRNGKGILKGVPLIRARAMRRDISEWGGRLYKPADTPFVECAVTAVPYFLWANRKPGGMAVWVLRNSALP